MVLWSLGAALIWMGVQSGRQRPGYGCLLYNGTQMVDVLTGFVITRRYPPELTRSVYYTTTADGRYRVQAAPYVPGRYDRYYLDLIPLHGGATIRLTDRLSYDYNYVPAPTGSRIVFWEVNPAFVERHYEGVVVDVDSSGTVTRRTLPAPSATGFRHWSPQGDTLVMEFPDSGQYSIWRDSGDFYTYPLNGSLSQDSIFFAPDGDVLFLINNRVTNRTDLYRASPDGFSQRTPFHPLSITNVRHWWSPDRRYVALSYTTNTPRGELTLLRLEDNAVIPLANWEGYTPPHQLEWTADSQSLMWIKENPFADGTRYNFFRHDLRTGETRLIEEGINEEPMLAPGTDPKRYAITHTQQGKQLVQILNLDGTNRVHVVMDADDAGNPYWSDDGARVAVVWARGKGTERQVWITAATRDGAEIRTWQGGFWDARNLLWLDGDHLAYVTWGGEAQYEALFGVEVMNVRTMERAILTSHMAEITLFASASNRRQIAFWWRDLDNRLGIDVFTVSGERIGHYWVTPEEQTSISGIVVFAGNYRAVMPGAPQIFPAPQGPTAALKLGPYQHESLHLATADGSWNQSLREGLYGLGDPLWSPDGEMVTFTQALDKTLPITLEIFDKEGVFVRSLDYSPLYNALMWTRCDQ